MNGLIHVGAWDGIEYMNEPGPLILFEPLPDAFEVLLDRFHDRGDVTLINKALGARMGTATMHRSHPSHSSSILPPKKHLAAYPWVSFDGTESVQVSTLDREMRGEGPEDFDRLVIDVQGYELEVLKGAKKTLKGIEWLKCEVSWEELYKGDAAFDDVEKFLATFGFERQELIEDGSGMCGDAIYTK